MLWFKELGFLWTNSNFHLWFLSFKKCLVLLQYVMHIHETHSWKWHNLNREVHTQFILVYFIRKCKYFKLYSSFISRHRYFSCVALTKTTHISIIPKPNNDVNYMLKAGSRNVNLKPFAFREYEIYRTGVSWVGVGVKLHQNVL